jgi:hypothetical protein
MRWRATRQHAVMAVLIACMGAAGTEAGLPRYKHLPRYAVPVQFWTEHSFHPVGYLEDYPVQVPTVLLDQVEKAALADLFRAAHYACRFKYRQSYFLQTDAPVYRLLKRQYPGLASLEGEGRRVVYLESVATFLERPDPTMGSGAHDNELQMLLPGRPGPRGPHRRGVPRRGYRVLHSLV